MIEITDLTVRFGGVKPLDAMSVTFDAGTCGLIGPNGAGKTTFFNVMSGFVKPAAGRRCTRSAKTCCACRTSGAPAGACGARSRPSRRSRSSRSSTTSRWSGSTRSTTGAANAPTTCSTRWRSSASKSTPRDKVGTLGARERRLVEVARAVVGRPKVVLLDEPAAGLSDAETEHLAAVIRSVPEHTGALVILVDHDMTLVSACCENTAVLDFGKLIAAGPTAAILRDERVVKAYLGTEEVQ